MKKYKCPQAEVLLFDEKESVLILASGTNAAAVVNDYIESHGAVSSVTIDLEGIVLTD